MIEWKPIADAPLEDKQWYLLRGGQVSNYLEWSADDQPPMVVAKYVAHGWAFAYDDFGFFVYYDSPTEYAELSNLKLDPPSPADEHDLVFHRS